MPPEIRFDSTASPRASSSRVERRARTGCRRRRAAARTRGRRQVGARRRAYARRSSSVRTGAPARRPSERGVDEGRARLGSERPSRANGRARLRAVRARYGSRRCTGTGRSSPRAPTPSRTGSSGAGSSPPTSCTTASARTAPAAAASAGRAPQLDETQQRIVDALRDRGLLRAAVRRALPRPGRLGAARGATGSGSSPRPRRGSPREAAGEESGLRRTSKEFVVRKNAYGVSLGLDDPWLGAGRRAAHARPREHLPRALVEARVRRPLVHEAGRRRGRAPVLAALAPRLQRQAPAEGVRLPQRRRRGGRPVRVRARAARPAASSATCGRGARSATTTRRRTSSPSGSRAGRSRRSPAPKGTMIFCNTSGFHRGGFATGKPRVLATFTYASPAALKSLSDRNFTLVRDERRGAHARRRASRSVD